jgi:membrane dipeptidase
MTEIDFRTTAASLYERSLIWDGHSGFSPDPLADLNNLQIWRRAGINYLSIDVGYDVMPWEDTVRTLANFRHWIGEHTDDFTIVSNVHQVRQAKRDGKLAITFDIEGANALDGRIEMVEFYHQLGVRQMVLAYNRNNLAAGGCHDEDTGLTEFGRQVVDELNRLGMFVDVTHCGYRTTMDTFEHSDRPVIFSHSNPKVLCDHERNITDEQIRACAATGGLIGLVGLGKFLADDISPENFANNISYVADLVGPEHVGITLDYAFDVDAPSAANVFERHPTYWPASQGYGTGTKQYLAPGQLIDVTEVLLRRGMSEHDVAGVLGENFSRLATEIWR